MFSNDRYDGRRPNKHVYTSAKTQSMTNFSETYNNSHTSLTKDVSQNK